MLLTVALVAVVAAGCGSSSSSTSSSAGSTSPESSSSSESTSTSGSTSASSSEGEQPEPALAFLGKGKKHKEVNLIIKSGTEAEPEDREAASSVLEENLEARAAKDWAGQCASLAAELVKAIEKSASPVLAKAGCAKLLGEQGEKVSPQVLEDTMEGPIAALRVKGSQGFALFHGKAGKDYVIPMAKEGGEWKVASLTPEEIPN